MNCTKISIPSPTLINIYFYYSNFALFLSLLITPLQFYVILTKSKNLNAFKWLILNHSFWCLTFEICFGIIKPIFFAPAPSGFLIGLFRNGTASVTVILVYVYSIIFIFQGVSLFATVINRYLYAFPSRISNFINMKYVLMIFVFGLIGGIIIFTSLTYQYLNIDHFEAYKSAVEYDSCLQIFFNEPSFVFLPISETFALSLYFYFSMYCAFIFIICLIFCYFIFLVLNHNTSASIAKLQKSLIISAIIQIFVSIVFLLFPVFSYVTVTCFQISVDSKFIIFCCCILISHSFLESIATLYFVSPYRKAVKKILGSILPYFKASVKPINPISQTYNITNINLPKTYHK